MLHVADPDFASRDSEHTRHTRVHGLKLAEAGGR